MSALFFGLNGAAMNPAADSRLLAWYRGEDLAGADFAAVAAFPDATGHGYGLTQVTVAARPTKRVGILHGRNVMRTDGGDDIAFGPGIGAHAEWTAFILIANASITGYARFFSLGDQGPELWTTPAGEAGIVHYASIDIISAGAEWDSAPHIWRLQLKSGALTLAKDGVVVATDPAFGFTYTLDKITLGAGATAFAEYASADFAEALVYGAGLSSGDNAKVEGYLRNKFGL